MESSLVKSRKPLWKRIDKLALFFIMPAFILYTAFVIIPSIMSLPLSMTNWDGISPTYRFVGLDNFIEIFKSPRFLGALWRTLLLTFLTMLISNVLALGLALLLDRVRWIKGFLRSVYYIPVLVSGIIAGFIWSTMYNWNFGVLNSLLQVLGIPAVDWIGNPDNVLYSLAYVIVWQRTGYHMVIYLAGLQGIPKDCLESAEIDGANGWKRFWGIIFPLLSGTMTINLTLALINGLRIFDQIAVLTNGGPGFSSETITYLIYRTGFGEGRQGFGTALAVTLFVLVFTMNFIQSNILRRREVQL